MSPPPHDQKLVLAVKLSLCLLIQIVCAVLVKRCDFSRPPLSTWDLLNPPIGASSELLSLTIPNLIKYPSALSMVLAADLHGICLWIFSALMEFHFPRTQQCSQRLYLPKSFLGMLLTVLMSSAIAYGMLEAWIAGGSPMAGLKEYVLMSSTVAVVVSLVVDVATGRRELARRKDGEEKEVVGEKVL